MYFITTKRMLEVCFSAHPNIQYRTGFILSPLHDNHISGTTSAATPYLPYDTHPANCRYPAGSQ